MRLRPACSRQIIRLALVLFPLLLAPWPLLADTQPSAPSLVSPEYSIEGVGLMGLEEPIRGGRAALGFRFRGIPFLPALHLAIVGDAGLSTWILEPSLALGLGGDISLIAGIVKPLGEAWVAAESGRRLRLTTAQALPSLLGIEAKLADRRLSKGWELALVASLEWIAWDIVAAEAEGFAVGFASTDALRCFAAGFGASLVARLGFCPAIVGTPNPAHD